MSESNVKHDSSVFGDFGDQSSMFSLSRKHCGQTECGIKVDMKEIDKHASYSKKKE